ncbi:hypothetical protein [Dyella mobilis]|uniref:RES domain-containing protein n=1 Tax=Dyella mobilis TaxID=1849582 RepID=A0ABS2KED7_9GAMM|nr:hypothetical protein [Dyella mobilis]MBM7129531.1 hypothetical protein [Dyella mobilis]GLQ98203.1 hypothetical protein GCM10007863_26230 [Dyella mobilis]
MARDSIEKIDDWPQPSTVGEASINACRSPYLISYATRDARLAVIEIHQCHYLVYGHPNDESLHGHPLFKSGLDYYSIHRIRNSSLIEMLEMRNAVHPMHSKARFLADMDHYLVTFQDATLEFVARVNEKFPLTVHIFNDAAHAEASLGRNVT